MRCSFLYKMALNKNICQLWFTSQNNQGIQLSKDRGTQDFQHHDIMDFYKYIMWFIRFIVVVMTLTNT